MTNFIHVKKWMVVTYIDEKIEHKIQNINNSDQQKIDNYNYEVLKNNYQKEKSNFDKKIETKTEPTIPVVETEKNYGNVFKNLITSNINTSASTSNPSLFNHIKLNKSPVKPKNIDSKRKAELNLTNLLDKSIIANRTRKKLNNKKLDIKDKINLNDFVSKVNNIVNNPKTKQKVSRLKKVNFENWRKYNSDKKDKQKDVEVQNITMLENDTEEENNEHEENIAEEEENTQANF